MAQAPKPASRGLLPTPQAPALLPPPRMDLAGPSTARPNTAVGRRRWTSAAIKVCAFNCNEKYVRGHNKTCKQLFVLELSNASDDESTDEEPAPTISLHTISGVRTSQTTQVPLRWRSTVLHALLDSESSHNFVSAAAAASIGIPFHRRDGLQATIANGERVPCLGAFNDSKFSIHGEPFQAEFLVLPLAGYDVVLGTQ
ncbi:hypothetical protein U9M48_036128 [Paspalum notatum var. saurae]|uniref:Uncharacterized protein n=1 Tax=Paspalum notatum var. saurae TaxID=547442 RepID=A0AAQ3UCJ2_PASNO